MARPPVPDPARVAARPRPARSLLARGTLGAALLVGLTACGGGSAPALTGLNADCARVLTAVRAIPVHDIDSIEPDDAARASHAAANLRVVAKTVDDPTLAKDLDGLVSAAGGYADALSGKDRSQTIIATGTLRRAVNPVADRCGLSPARLVSN